MKEVVVIKVGGSLLHDDDLESLFDDLRKITKHRKVVLVHGWSYEVNAMYFQLKLEPTFYSSARGFISRKTDEQALKIILMVAAGLLNKSIVHSLNQKNIVSIGLSGIDGQILKAERKTFRIREGETLRQISDDYTGKIFSVDSEKIAKFLEYHDCLVLTPLAVGKKMELLSTDADRAAAQIAIALQSSHLIYLSNVDGYQQGGKIVRLLNKKLLSEAISVASKGMKKKLWAAREALEGNVRKIIIGDGKKNFPITRLLQGYEGSSISL